MRDCLPVLVLNSNGLIDFYFPEIIRKPTFSDNFRGMEVLGFQSQENLAELLEL